MHKKCLFVFLFFSVSCSAIDLPKSELMQKSLEELKGLHAKKLEELAPTAQSKKLLKQWQYYGDLSLKAGDFARSCVKYRESRGYLGYADDCQKALDMDKVRHEQKQRIEFAEKRLREANPDLMLIEECILEKEYEEMEVE